MNPIQTMKTYNILFLCTHNSARSVLGEAIASTQTKGRFVGFSAGSTPKHAINPFALELALEMGYPLEKLRSKAWDEYALPGAPQMDFIVTVCDNAAGEVCPVWLGHPLTAHWGFPDPSQVQGTNNEKRAAFKTVMQVLKAKIQALAALPLETMDAEEIQAAMRMMGNV